MKQHLVKVWLCTIVPSIIATGVFGCSGGSSSPSSPAPGNPFTGVFRREASYPDEFGNMVDWGLTFNLTQNGTTITGTAEGAFTTTCCEGTIVRPLEGTANGNVATLVWTSGESTCTGTGCSFRGFLAGGNYNARLTNNEQTLHFDVTGNDYQRQ